MHATSTSQTTFQHNGDYSGGVLFIAPDAVTGEPRDAAAPMGVLVAAAARELIRAGDDTTLIEIGARGNGHCASTRYTDEHFTVVVPLGDLRKLFGKRVRSEKIAALEEASTVELVNGAAAEILSWMEDESAWD